MSDNSNMSKLIQLVEGQQFAGEPEQKPGDQVRGTDRVVSHGTQHPFHNRLVGEETTLEDTLAKKYSNFKDVQSKKKDVVENDSVQSYNFFVTPNRGRPLFLFGDKFDIEPLRKQMDQYTGEGSKISIMGKLEKVVEDDEIQNYKFFVTPGRGRPLVLHMSKYDLLSLSDQLNNWRFGSKITLTGKLEEESDHEGLNEATADSKIASLQKKIKDAQDAMGLARERRRMKGQRQQGTREMSLQKKIDGLRQEIDGIEREAARTTESEDFGNSEEQLNELSTSLLGKYKTAAGKAATAADVRGDFETGHKRFKGIMKATKKQFANDTKGTKKESAKLGEASGNPVDKITMDVPLMIRIMEYAREDAKTDMDLHDVAEKLIELGSSGRTLSMQDYSAIMSQQNEGQINELGATGSVAQAQTLPGLTKPTGTTGTTSTTQQTQANTSPTTTTTSSSPTTTAPATPPAKLNPDEQTALNKIMANAGLKGQFQQLIQKAKTVPGA